MQLVEPGANANLHWVGLGLGSGHGKLRMETDINGAGATARVTGAYAGHGSQHLDYETTQEHAAPHTVSDLAFRGVLRDALQTRSSRLVEVPVLRPFPARQPAMQRLRLSAQAGRPQARAFGGTPKGSLLGGRGASSSVRETDDDAGATIATVHTRGAAESALRAHVTP